MPRENPSLAQAIEHYLASRPRAARWLEWLAGRRYRLAAFPDRALPVMVIAHRGRNPARAEQVARAIEHDWAETPHHCRDAYEEILAQAPGLIVVQLRRKNVCGCLGHRHVIVKELPFAEPHDAFGDAAVGEMDIAFDRVESWLALPLMDTALDTQFIAGSRLRNSTTNNCASACSVSCCMKPTTWWPPRQPKMWCAVAA